MKSIFKVIIFVIVIILFLHFRKYRNYTNEYRIDQQELDYIKGPELYNQLDPLIITFIEEISLYNNISKYSLYSPLSINKKTGKYNPNNDYLLHNNELFFIRPKKEVRIELVNPKFTKFFKYKQKDEYLKKYILDKSNFNKVQSIDVIIREYNILFIPRHWLFKFDTNDQTIDVYKTDNIFTYFFTLLRL